MSKSKSEQIIDILRELLYTIDERVAKEEAELDAYNEMSEDINKVINNAIKELDKVG